MASWVIHPFRSTRMFVRVCLGKPVFKPGSRHDRRLQAKLAELQRRDDEDEARIEAEEIEGLLRGYDTIATNTDDVWEMDYEDIEDSGQ